MLIHTDAITGEEKYEVLVPTPRDALVEFYRAFNHGDLALMTDNWLQTEEASMSNPLGGVKRGWSEISQVYKNIFNGSAKVYVEYYDYSIHQTADMFVAVGKERGYFQKQETKIELTIRTSRIYRKQNKRWYQVHHHGSIDDPALLKQYQLAVVGK